MEGRKLYDRVTLEGAVSRWTTPVPSLATLVSVVLILSCGQTDRITQAGQRYTHATTVGVSKAQFPLPELTARVNSPS